MTVEVVMSRQANIKEYQLSLSITVKKCLFFSRGPLKSMLTLFQGLVALINVSDGFR